MNIFFYRPGTQHQNSGDALINKGAVEYLSQYGKVVVDKHGLPRSYIEYIVNSKDGASESAAEIACWGGAKFYLNVMRAALRSPNKIWIVYPPGDVSRKGWRAALLHIRLIIVTLGMQIMGVDFIRLGFSVGPFDRKNGLLHSWWGRLFCAYGVRDSASLELMRSYKVNSAKFFPDFSLIGKVKGDFHDNKQRNKIAVSFRGGAYGSKIDELLVGRIEAWLRKCDFTLDDELCFFYQVEHDRELNCGFAERLSQRASVEVVQDRITPEKIDYFYHDKKVVISNRLHVLLYALKNGCLPIAVVDRKSNRKIVSLFKDIGLEDFIFDLDQGYLVKEELDKLSQTLERCFSGMSGYTEAALNFGLVHLKES